MAAKSTDEHALYWDARLNTDKFAEDAKGLAKIMNQQGFKLFDTADIKKQFEEIKNQNKENTKAVAESAKATVKIMKDSNSFQVAEAKKAQQQITADTETEIQKRARLYTGASQQGGGKSAVAYQFGSPVKQTDSSIISADYLKRLDEAVKKYDDISITEKNYIEQLALLRVEETKLIALQKELNGLRAKGVVTEEQYVASTTELAAAQKQVGDSINATKEGQRQLLITEEALLTGTNAQIAKVKELTASYYALTDAEKASAGGQAKLKEITELNTAISVAKKETTEVAKAATSATSSVSKFASGVFSSLRQVAYLIPGIGLTGLIGGIVDIVLSGLRELVGGTQDFISKQRLMADALTAVGQKYGEAAANIRPYIDALRNGNATEQSKLTLYNKLVEINPKYVAGIDKAKIATYQLIEAGENYLNVLRETVRAQVNDEKLRASITQEELLSEKIKKARKNVEDLKKLNESVGDQFANTSALGGPQNSIKGRYEEALAEAEKYQLALNAQRKVTEEIGTGAIKQQDDFLVLTDRGTDALNKQIDALEKLRGKTSDKTQLAAIDLGINALKAELKQIEAKTDKQVSGENAYQRLLQKRKDKILDIASAERDATQTGLLKQASEIDNINQKYDEQIQTIAKLNAEIDRYNAKTKGDKVSNISQSDIDRLNAARTTEINNYNYKKDSENFIEQLQLKEEAFQKLQAVMQEGSTEQVEFTKQQYTKELEGFDSYSALLKAKLASISLDVISGTADPGQIAKFAGLTKLLEGAFKAEGEARKQQEIKNLDDLLAAAKTFQAKRADIDKKYTAAYATLEKQKTQISVTEYNLRKDKLAKSRDKDVADLANEFLEQNEAFKKFSEGFDNLGKGAIELVLKKLKEAREEIIKMGGDLTAVNKAIKATQDALGNVTAKGFQDAANIISKVGKDLEISLSSTLKITTQQISDLLNNVSTLFSSSASKSDQVGSIVGIVTSVFTTIRDALLTAEDMADPLQAQKDAYEAIGAAIDANNFKLQRQQDIIDDLNGAQKIQAQQSMLVELKDQQDKALKSLQDFKVEYIKSSKEIFVDPLFNTETENSGVWGAFTNLWTAGTVKKKIKYDLEVVDTSGFNTIEDFKDLLQQIKDNGGKIDGKTVVDEDLKGLEALIDDYDTAIQKQKELKQQLDEIFTGTTQQSIADNLIAGFQAGKHSAQDFADDFETMMKGAILNSLKFQTLEPAIEAFYQEFASKSASDGTLTQEEIAQLRQNYDDIIKKANQQYENLQQITDIDLSGSTNSANGLSGAIKGITENQADLLAGQFGGMRLTLIDQLEEARTQVQILSRIEQNTAILRPILTMFSKWDTQGLQMR